MQTADVYLAGRKTVSLMIFSLLLVLLSPAANAVTKHLSMIGGDGKPLIKTLISIGYPDGSTANAMTDEKGILKYKFNQAGEYTLSDPAGNVVKTVSVAGGGVNSKVLIVTAAAVGAGLLIVAAGSGGDDDTGGGQPAPPVDPVDPVDPEEPIAEDSIAGSYNVTTSIASNPGGLPVLLDTLVLQLEIIGTLLTITQTSSNANFPSQLSGTIAGESFAASSTGTYGGVATLFQLAGSIAAGQPLNFLINIGSDGSFPDGQIITYNATGRK